MAEKTPTGYAQALIPHLVVKGGAAAVEFYKALGGKAVARSSERFGDKSLEKVAFAWNN